MTTNDIKTFISSDESGTLLLASKKAMSEYPT